MNTPDILTEQLQQGDEATFASRLILAATLSPSYGVYSGFESVENQAVRAGSEEYLDSEKYEAKERGLHGRLLPLVADLNRIRRHHPPLQHLDGIRFLDTDDPALGRPTPASATGPPCCAWCCSTPQDPARSARTCPRRSRPAAVVHRRGPADR